MSSSRIKNLSTYPRSPFDSHSEGRGEDSQEHSSSESSNGNDDRDEYYHSSSEPAGRGDYSDPDTTLGGDEFPSLEDKGLQENKDNGPDLLSNPFENKASKELFDAIDKIRKCGAGQDLDLPQLVIVGKQSAGKSSLLQSLTQVPFPVGGKLCTRFATRIVSRRTKPGTLDAVHISIESGDVDPFQYQEPASQTDDFNCPVATPLTAEVFEEIIEQASEAMGISKSQNFSSKVLKIELSGPKRSHFGILDLPGVFSAPTGGVTRQEMNGVKKMVTSYMKKPQNIIICVADATDDVANQEIFTMAAELVDPSRMVGVFTKCDRTQHPEEIVRIVNCNEGTDGRPLQNGWYVVQNKGPSNAEENIDRETQESSTFSNSPWTQLPEARRGTAKLKEFLADILCQQIRKEFPGMTKTLGKLLQEQMSLSTALGAPRRTVSLRRQYLHGIAAKYQDYAKSALESPGDLLMDDAKLRGMVVKAHHDFVEDVRTNGPTHKFVNANDSGTNSASTSLYRQIRHQMGANRGVELEGMINPAVLKPLFKIQAARWPSLAKKHLNTIAEDTRLALVLILDTVCQELHIDKYTKEGLEEKILEFTEIAFQKTLAKLDQWWHEDVDFHPRTSNRLFSLKVQEAQLQRFQAALDRYRARRPASMFLVNLTENPNDLQRAPDIYKSWAIIDTMDLHDVFQEMNARGSRNTEDEIHDILKAYYEIAEEDFVTHVGRHIIEPYLYDPEGPVKGLSPEWVIGLEDETIDVLGGEHEDVVKKREEVESRIERLQTAKNIAEQALRKTRSSGIVV